MNCIQETEFNQLLMIMQNAYIEINQSTLTIRHMLQTSQTTYSKKQIELIEIRFNHLRYIHHVFQKAHLFITKSFHKYYFYFYWSQLFLERKNGLLILEVAVQTLTMQNNLDGQLRWLHRKTCKKCPTNRFGKISEGSVHIILQNH